MGLNWLVGFGARAAEKRDGEAVRKRTISKGKGKEVLEESELICESSGGGSEDWIPGSSRSRSRTASVRSGILSECTVLISSKFEVSRCSYHPCVLKLMRGVLVRSSSTGEPHHFCWRYRRCRLLDRRHTARSHWQEVRRVLRRV
jgi:hypothetical protein